MISVIIPSYNEREDLVKAIESLGEQSLKDFEIIIVDDGSTDGTIQLLKNLKKTIPNYRFIKQKHEGAGSARNLGAKISKGSILVFVDADMTFEKDFLRKLVAPIQKNLSKGTFSKEEYVANWDNRWARALNINQGWEDKRRHPSGYPDRQPVFRAILKSEFVRVDGFTPGGYDDDWSLSKKLNYDAENAPGAVFYHKNPGTLREIFTHARWIAKRNYKLGIIGLLYNLVLHSLPVSLCIGIIKAIQSRSPHFVVWKLIYDLGIFLGLLQLAFRGSLKK